MISANGGINQQRVAVSSPVILSRCVTSNVYSIIFSNAFGDFLVLCMVVVHKKCLFVLFFY